jgi:hypothetical protein
MVTTEDRHHHLNTPTNRSSTTTQHPILSHHRRRLSSNSSSNNSNNNILRPLIRPSINSINRSSNSINSITPAIHHLVRLFHQSSSPTLRLVRRKSSQTTWLRSGTRMTHGTRQSITSTTNITIRAMPPRRP